MASNKVFRSYELLENILLFLPLRDLLVSKRINKACCDVVKRSENVNTALFLQASASLTTQREGCEIMKPILNPFFVVRRIRLEYMEEELEQALQEVKCPVYITFGTVNVSGFACYRERPDIPRETNSRDKMFLTQPPGGKLKVGSEDDDDVDVGSDSGTTHGDLIDYGSSRWEGFFAELLEEVKRGELQRDEVELAMYSMDQSVTWRRLVRDVDNITGFEMLAMLQNPDALDGEVIDGGDDVYGGDSEDGSEYWSSDEED